MDVLNNTLGLFMMTGLEFFLEHIPAPLSKLLPWEETNRGRVFSKHLIFIPHPTPTSFFFYLVGKISDSWTAYIYLMTPDALEMNHGGLLSLPPYYFISNSISVSTVIAALGETLLKEELAELWWFGNRKVERK